MLRRLLAPTTAVLLAIGCATATSASAAVGTRRVGAAPSIPSGARVSGALAGDTSLSVTVALASRDPAGLAAYAAGVSEADSLDYHRYLSVAQFAQRFGASATALAAVRSWLKGRDLSPGAVSPNGLSLTVDATASRFAKAFSTTFRRLTLRGGRATYANVSAPALGAGIAHDVQGIVGLDDLAAPRPLDRVATRAARTSRVTPRSQAHASNAVSPCASATAAAAGPDSGAYTIDQIASGYDFGGLYASGDEGAGVTVAVYELEGNFPSDISAYQSCFGTDATVSYESVDGGPSSPNPNNGDGVETELDLENLIGLAPKVNVLVYQGPNTAQGGMATYEAIISADRAKVIETSWGECEADLGQSTAKSEATLFEEAAVQGETVIAAAGDDGAQDCYGETALPDTSVAVDDPASQPFVTGVGGTTLSSAGQHSETVWNNGVASVPQGGGAAGGGDSTFWTMPGYQSSAASSLNVINSQSSSSDCGASPGTYCREVPDVSADADPNTGYLIYWDGNGQDTDSNGWIAVGGTSGAVPVWSAVLALADASSTCTAPIGFANPALYSAASGNYGADFNDVTSGNNDLLDTSGSLYTAGTGYDQASGLGTPIASTLVPSLCSQTRLAVASPGAQNGQLKHPAALQLHASDSAGSTVSYSGSGLPPGLTLAASTGLISGTPTTAGIYQVKIVAVDSRDRVQTIGFTWTIGTLPTLTQASITGTAKRRANLAFRVAEGVDGQPVKTISFKLPAGLSFARRGSALSRLITMRSSAGGKLGFTASLSGGLLTLTLHSAAKLAQVRISNPALGTSTSLARMAASHKSPQLKLAVTVLDAGGFSNALQAKVKPS